MVLQGERGIFVSERTAELSDRQRQILRLSGQGLFNKEIGKKLGISEQTVKNIKKLAFARLGIEGSTVGKSFKAKLGMEDSTVQLPEDFEARLRILTPRESELFETMAQDSLVDSETAARFSISVRTVRNHFHSCYKKLDIDGKEIGRNLLRAFYKEKGINSLKELDGNNSGSVVFKRGK